MSTRHLPPATGVTLAELDLLPQLCTLVTYAIDADRVLRAFGNWASLVPDFSLQLSRACDTWQNPDHDGDLSDALIGAQDYIAKAMGRLVAAQREAA